MLEFLIGTGAIAAIVGIIWLFTVTQIGRYTWIPSAAAVVFGCFYTLGFAILHGDNQKVDFPDWIATVTIGGLLLLAISLLSTLDD